MKKRIAALLFAIITTVCFVNPVSFAENGSVTLDELVGNLLSNGTFENGIDGWSASGVTASVEMDNTHNNSAKAIKLAGEGSISTSAQLYKQETYDVSLWAKPVSENTTISVKVGDKTVLEEKISAETVLTGKVNISGTSYNGAVVNPSSTVVSITVDNSCYIDDIVLTEAENKVINAVSASDLGAWVKKGEGVELSYNSDENAAETKNTYNGDNAIMQYLALKKGSTYEISADIKLLDTSEANKMYCLIGRKGGNKSIIGSAAVSKNEWKTYTTTYTNNDYPTDGAVGSLAGLHLAFFGWSSTSKADFLIKNVSVKEVKNEQKYTKPSAAVTADKADTITPVVVPTVDNGDKAYYMYRYIANGSAVDTGFGETVPAYTVPSDFEGTISLVVTPVNSQGTYGDSETVNISYTAPIAENNGVSDLDEAIGNKIINGTFDNGMPTGWNLSGGVKLEKEIENTASDSVAAAKVTTSAENIEIEIDGTRMKSIYAEQAYEMSMLVKPINTEKPLDVNVKASITGTEKNPLASATIPAGTSEWTKVSGKVSRFSGGNKNNAATVLNPEQINLTIGLSANCYIDEITLKPADNYVTDENVKLNGSAAVTEVKGWTLKGNAEAEDAGENGLKACVSSGVTNALMQGVVLEKGASYKMTAEVKKQKDSANNKLKLYLGYNAATKTVTLTDDWQTVEVNLTSDKTNNFSADKVGSSVYIGADGAADLYIRNISVTKVKRFTNAPVVSKVSLKQNVLAGDNAAATAAVTIENGDAAGFKYLYKLNGVPFMSGYAVKETDIPACGIPAAESGKLTLELIAVGSEGLHSLKAVSNECNIIKKFTVEAPQISSAQITAGNRIELKINVTNNTEADENLAVIAAYYEKNVLKACEIDEKPSVKGAATGYDVSITMPQDISGNGKLNLFVWKGYNGQTFLMEPVSDMIPLTE